MSEKHKEIIVGISGVTCGGKTTIANKLNNILPNCKIFSQDDYFLDNDDPRHKWISELNHVNYDVLTSLDMEKMYKDVINALNDKKLVRKNHFFNKNLHGMNDYQNIFDKIKAAKLKVLIVEGFSIFNYEPLVPLFDLKYYFTLTKEECYQRRSLRAYNPPDVPGYFENCVWPEHLLQFEEVQTNDDVKYFSGNNQTDEVVKSIIKDIFMLNSI